MVANECNDSSITWYPDYISAKAAADAAVPATDVSKVKVSTSGLAPGQSITMRVKLKARGTHRDGTAIVKGELAINHADVKSSLLGDTYMNTSYRPRDESLAHGSVGHGDRLIFSRAKARIQKTMSPTSLGLGDEANVTLSPSFTIAGPFPVTGTLWITDILPNGLGYVSGTTIGTYDGGTPYGEPLVIPNATNADCSTYASSAMARAVPCGTLNGGTGKETLLVWDFGQQDTGTLYNDLNFTTYVKIDAPAGTLKNYAQIDSDASAPLPHLKVANANVQVTVPSALLLGKEVLTPLHEINSGGLLNWMEFRIGARNGGGTNLVKLDIIDLLPFNGDGTVGSMNFTPLGGTTIQPTRTPATSYTGDFQLDSVSFDDNGMCDATNVEFWFTNAAGPLDIGPNAASNTKADGTPESIWCQGTMAGPDAACGFTNAQVTAVRSRNVNINSGQTCFLKVKYSTNNNTENDIYSNTAAANAEAPGGTKLDGVLSATVSARVFASSIGDLVWLDANGDGVQAGDATEPGIDGVTVKLYDNGGTLIATTVTAGGGLYHFGGLESGDYVVEVNTTGYVVTTQSVGGNTAIDSDIDTVTHRTGNITLGVHEDIVNIDAGLKEVSIVISGNVFDDGDGNGNVNGGAINTPSGTQLHATLVDSSGTAVATKAIAADGTYSFNQADGVMANSSYTIVLSTTTNSTTASLPANWNNTGENLNEATGTGKDATADGVISVDTLTSDIAKIDFGINHKPTADDKTVPSQFNPGGTARANVPTLTGADDESATLVYTITTLPANATLYYNNVAITVANFVVADPTLLTVDPDTGDQTVEFDYTTTDEAGIVSDPATVNMPFTGLQVSGNIYDDGDNNGNVNGTLISAPSGTQLHATLLNAGGVAIATHPISGTGTYLFTDADGILPNTNYSIVLAITPNATIPSLPADWNNADGEIANNPGIGTDGTADGIVSVSVVTSNVLNNDFGINHRPTADDKTEASQNNPGGTTTVTVPTLTGADDESATLVYTITTLPDNATLYYNTIEITAADIAGSGFVVANPALLTVDPDDGSQTVEFDYTTTDAAGVVSAPATVRIPFVGIEVSGHVYDDGNNNGDIDGTLISAPSGTQLYATLVNAGGTAIATQAITAGGTYLFTDADGVTLNTTFTVVLSTSLNATTPSLPTDWNNADGEIANNLGNGTDGATDGIVTVVVGANGVPNNDFGINHRPVANDTARASQINPGGSTTRVVPDLNVTDTEDGTPTTITIKSLPTNGTLYYNGAPVAVNDVIVGYNPALLSVDPIDGDQTITFNYTTTDAAGVESAEATVTMPFVGLGISGTLFDDGDGDANVNGTAISQADGTVLYVSLVAADGNVLASNALNADGTYQFIGADGVTANTTYSIVLSTTQGVVGNTAPVAALPANWNNTGENINSAGAGNDGDANGTVAVSLATVGIVNVDFGINHRPTAADRTEPAQSNPAGAHQYQVPALPIADTEDGTPTTITIQTLPDATTGILYYQGNPVTAGQVITNYNPAELTVDPVEGNPILVFDYTTTDAAGIESSVATVTLPFLGDMFVGDRVWMDTNGNGSQDSGEIGVSGIAVRLFSADGSLIGTTETNSTGEYIFKVENPGNYYIEFDSTRFYTVDCPPCNDSEDSDVNGTNYRTAVFALNYGQTDLSHDAGIAPTAHIGDYVWIDTDANGIQDSDENPIPNATIELYDTEGNPVEDVHGNHQVISDSDGKYSFDVIPGDYVVKFILPDGYDGYIFSAADQGDDDSKDTDVSSDGLIKVPVHAVAGQQNVTLDAGVNCGCSDIKSDSGDALSTLGFLLMILSTIGIALLFIRREELRV